MQEILAQQKRDLEAFIQQIPAYDSTNYCDQGIVICAGHPTAGSGGNTQNGTPASAGQTTPNGINYNYSAFLTVYTLRNILHCQLPIEWYHYGTDEMPDNFRRFLLQNFSNLRIIDANLIRSLEGHSQITPLKGYRIKAFSILVSGFRDILYLDADCIPLDDPTYLFSTPEYTQYGNLFMPDFSFTPENTAMERAVCPGGAQAFELMGTKDPRTVGLNLTESGVILVNKERFWRELNVAWWLNNRADVFYKYFCGDKDLWWVAFSAIRNDQYYQNRHRPDGIGHTPLLIHTIVQKDYAGKPLFYHRTISKWELVEKHGLFCKFYHTNVGVCNVSHSMVCPMLAEYNYADMTGDLDTPQLEMYTVPKIYRDMESQLLQILRALIAFSTTGTFTDTGLPAPTIDTQIPQANSPQTANSNIFDMCEAKNAGIVLNDLPNDVAWKQLVKWLNAGKADHSRRGAKFLLTRIPNNPLCQNMIALSYQKLGKYRNADKYFFLALLNAGKGLANTSDHTIIARNFIKNSFIIRDLAIKSIHESAKTMNDTVSNTSENPDIVLRKRFDAIRDRIFNRCLGFHYFYELGEFDLAIKYYQRGDTVSQIYAKLKLSRLFSSSSAMYGERKMFEDNLVELLMKVRTKRIKFAPAEIEEPLFLGFNYHLAYQNRNNAPVHSKVNMLYKNIFPQLNYTSKWVDGVKRVKKPHVAFISTHFGNHSVTRDRIGIIENLDRTRFDVTCCWFKPPEDHLGNILWNMTNKRNVALFGGTFLHTREIIEKEQFDAIVYCDLGMSYETYFLACCRLAPVQITTWGHSDTSGINHTVDYFVSSKWFETPDIPVNRSLMDCTFRTAAKNYTEKLVCLNSLGTYYYKPEYPLNNLQDYPEYDFDTLYPGKHIYVCPQYLFKFSPDFINIIVSINNQDKAAHFVFLNLGPPQDKDRLIDIFRYEMDIENITFIEKIMEHEKYMIFLKRARFILDTYPFGGCNSSLEAFSIGVPIITMPSTFLNGRFTYGFYQRMMANNPTATTCIADMIVDSPENYVKLAIRCAKDRAFVKSVGECIQGASQVLYKDVQSVRDWEGFLTDALKDTIGSIDDVKK